MPDVPEIVMVARNQSIDDLIRECAEGRLPFSGPDSLWSKIHAMGYSCNYLHEMVCMAEANLRSTKA